MIIAINQGAVDFIAQEGRELFPDAPVLIPILEQDPSWFGKPRQTIQLLTRQDVQGTIQYAMNLFPKTKRVEIIMGKDDQAAPFVGTVQKTLSALYPSLEFEDTRKFSYEEMLQHISELPPDTILI